MSVVAGRRHSMREAGGDSKMNSILPLPARLLLFVTWFCVFDVVHQLLVLTLKYCCHYIR